MAKAKTTKPKEEVVAEKPEVKAPEVENISFEDFLKTRAVPVHPGLLASFTYEENNGGKGLEARPEGEWIQALSAQENKTY